MGLFDSGRRGGDAVAHDRVLTVPNGLTLLRLAGLPLFGWLLLVADRPAAAFWTLVVVASTDWIDGYVARRFDQVSRLGQLMDPLVDRIVIVVVGVALMVADLLPWPILVAIALRDAVVLGGALVLFGGVPPIPVTRTGKFATACLFVALPLFLVATFVGPSVRVVALALSAVGLVAYYVAGGQYARRAWAIRHDRAAS